jgi:hypothetical protein
VLIVFFQIRSQRHLLRAASEASSAKDEDAPAAS